MKKSLVVLSVLSIAFFCSSKAWSQNDVVVDLSVLGEVGSVSGTQTENVYQPVPDVYDMPVYEEAPAIPPIQGAIPAPSTEVQPGSVSTILNLPPIEPQFPVVKPKPKIVKKARPVSKVKPVAKVEKAEEKKVEETPKTVEESYSVSVVSEPTAEEVAKVLEDVNKAQEEANELISENVTVEISTDYAAGENNNADITAEEMSGNVEETVDAIETKKVNVEKVIGKANDDLRVEEETISDEISEKTPSTGAPTQLVTPTQMVVTNKEIVESTLDGSDTKKDSAATVVESIETAVETENLVEAKELKDDTAAKVEIVSNIIVFDGEETTLTESDKERIIKLVSTFENPGQNKIGIFSYNLDNGEDVFKRKRQSLSRATEVRSFLISKGYKNYSIKVVNVDESSDKVNTVEIVEIK